MKVKIRQKKQIFKIKTNSGSVYTIVCEQYGDGIHMACTLRTKEGEFEIIAFSEGKMNENQIRASRPRYLPINSFRPGMYINGKSIDRKVITTGRITEIYRKTGLFSWKRVASAAE